MLKDKAIEYYRDRGCNCAEGALLSISDEYVLGLTDEDAKLMGGFGGGLGSGLTCGSLCGAVAALGKMYLPGRAHASPEFRTLCGEYVAAFREALGSTECAELKKLWDRGDGRRCAAVMEKNAELFEAFVKEHGLDE